MELQIEFSFMGLKVHLKVNLVFGKQPLLGFQNAGRHVCQILRPVISTPGVSRPIVLRHASCPLVLLTVSLHREKMDQQKLPGRACQKTY